MTVLSVRNLRKSFGANVNVLNNISFDLEEGQVLAILGESGGGKTTLLRCINFLEAADSGTISICGETAYDGENPKSVSKETFKRLRLKLGMVFQQFNLFPQYSALKNVMIGPMNLKKGTKAEIKKKAMDILAQVGLTDRATFYPANLSGGQQQRVAIARALALDPEILCFDEPTSALDPSLVGDVIEVIKELASRGTTMIIVTHDMNFAHAVADRVIFMARGVIEEDAPVDEFFDNPKSPKLKAFLGVN